MQKTLVFAVALALAGCNSVSLSNLIPKSDPAPSSQPAATQTAAKSSEASKSSESGSSGFSFSDILYGGAKPPSRVIADNEDPPADRIEVVEEHRGTRVGTRRVVGAVDDDQRLVTHHLETPGHPHVGEPLGHDVARYRRREEGLDRCE